MKTKEELSQLSHDELEDLVIELQKQLDEQTANVQLWYNAAQRYTRRLDLMRQTIKHVVALSEDGNV